MQTVNLIDLRICLAFFVCFMLFILSCEMNPTEPDVSSAHGGTFNNGTSDITVSSFVINTFETRQSEYLAVMGLNPSYFSAVANGPVDRVNWFDAIEYCNRKSIQDNLTPCYRYTNYGTNPDDWPWGWNLDDDNHTNVLCNWTANGYRLPTEVEWEYAALGGNKTHNYLYSGSNDIDLVAWYDINASSTTHTVGTKKSNELGIHDMSGNVWEWCWDISGSYPEVPQNNPTGATSGTARIFRGGSWINDASNTELNHRKSANPTYRSYGLGFRVVRS